MRQIAGYIRSLQQIAERNASQTLLQESDLE